MATISIRPTYMNLRQAKINNVSSIDTDFIQIGAIAHSLTTTEIVDAIYGWNGAVWSPVGFSSISDAVRLKDENSEYWLDLFLITVTDSNNDPLLGTDQGMIIKKDLSVGGFVGSNQGAVGLGHGLNQYNQPPQIWLTHSDTASYYDKTGTPGSVNYTTLHVTDITGNTVVDFRARDIIACGSLIFSNDTNSYNYVAHDLYMKYYGSNSIITNGNMVISNTITKGLYLDNAGFQLSLTHDNTNGYLTSYGGALKLSTEDGNTVRIDNNEFYCKTLNTDAINNLSSLIIAGTNLSWSGNTLNASGAGGGVGSLSDLVIDTAKDWLGYSITNLGTLLPSGSNLRDLGGSSNYWKDVYVKGTIHLADPTTGTATPQIKTIWIPRDIYGGAAESPLVICDRHLGTMRDLWAYGALFSSEGSIFISNNHSTTDTAHIGHDNTGIRVDHHFVPASDSAYSLGTSGIRWDAVYADDFYGVVRYSDIHFKDSICVNCGQPFEKGQQLKLQVTGFTICAEGEEMMAVPVHMKCSLKYRLKGIIRWLT